MGNSKKPMEPKRSRKSSVDSLEYLKFALTNCQKARLKDEHLERERNKAKQIKVVNTKGSTFSYSVTSWSSLY